MIQHWLSYMALSIALYTVNTLLNKMTARDYPGEFAGLALLLTVSAMLLPFVGDLPQGTEVWVPTLVAAFCYGVSTIMSFDAYSIGEVSLFVPIFNFQPVFVLFLAHFFLSETIGIQKLIGVMLVFLGATHLKASHDFISSLKALFKVRSVSLALMATFLFSIGRIMDKLVLSNFDTLTYAFVQWFLPALVVATYVLGRHETKEFVKFFKKRFALIFVNSLSASLAYITLLMALGQVEVSVITPLANLSTFFVVVLAHRVLGEKLNGRPLAAAVMVIGAALVAMTPLV